MLEQKFILLDCGDTLVDEATEVKDARGAVLRADLIPGAAAMVRELKARGWTLGLVADGPEATFRNVLGFHGLWDSFSAFAISETVGVEKPDPLMFTSALVALGVRPADYPRVPMVGNNLERDIRGANALGLISIWISWSPRRKRTPGHRLEVPDHEIRRPEDLVPLLLGGELGRNRASDR